MPRPTVNATLAALASSFLEPWRGGVAESDVDEAHLRWADYRDPQWGGYVPLGEARNRLLRVNIIDGKLHFVNSVGSKSLRRATRQRAVLRLLQTTLNAYSLPDVDFVLSVSDRPTVPKRAFEAAHSHIRSHGRSTGRDGGQSELPGAHRRTPPPVFGYASTRSHYTLPFPPVSFDPARWPRLHARIGSHPPLAARARTALWRGTCNSLCDMMASRRCKLPRDVNLLPRLQLLTASARCPRACDVGVTSAHKNCATFAPKAAVPMTAHAQHALLLHVDGNGFSGRLDELLTLGGAVLKQDSPFYAYYYPLLHRGVHFEPLHRNLSDLCAKTQALITGLEQASGTVRVDSVLDEGQSRRSRAADLAHASTLFAQRYLSPDAVHVYVAELLRQYAALQRFKPRLNPQAIRWKEPSGSSQALSVASDRRARGRGRREIGQASSGAKGMLSYSSACGAQDASCCRRHPKACRRMVQD